MAIYFFHLRNQHDRILDLAGRQLTDLEAVEAAAIEEARGVLAADAKAGRLDFRQRVEVEDERGQLVYSLPLADAVEVVGLKDLRARGGTPGG